MDVKSAFLNKFIMEKVYVEQPSGFEDVSKPDHVLKLKKAFYGFKQALRAWYEILSIFLIDQGFVKGKADITLFIKNKKNNLLIVQIYIEDIIFRSTNDSLCQEFSKVMQGEFEMSMIGELNFFLGLQIKQKKNEIFISQTKYLQDLLKKYGMDHCNGVDTSMSSTTLLYVGVKG